MCLGPKMANAVVLWVIANFRVTLVNTKGVGITFSVVHVLIGMCGIVYKAADYTYQVILE